MTGYLKGYMTALNDVLNEISVESPDNLNPVLSIIRHMIDDTDSE